MEKLITSLQNMSNDSQPELQEKAKEVLTMLQTKS